MKKKKLLEALQYFANLIRLYTLESLVAHHYHRRQPTCTKAAANLK
jgi:hypothetical protein